MQREVCPSPTSVSAVPVFNPLNICCNPPDVLRCQVLPSVVGESGWKTVGTCISPLVDGGFYATDQPDDLTAMVHYTPTWRSDWHDPVQAKLTM